MSNYYDTLCNLNLDFSISHLLLNLDALDNNIKYINTYSHGKKIRIATKSVRSVEMLKYIAAKIDNFYGWMTYSTEEALWLRSLGFTNLLVGYPKWDKNSLSELAQNPEHITLMIDSISQLQQIHSLVKTNTKISICIDCDLSLDLPFLRFGVYRSPIQKIDDLKDIVHFLNQHKNFYLKGIMGYEAQIAGVGDKSHPLIKILKAISIPHLRKRRQELYDYLIQQGFSLELVNGGGSGSLKSTTQEKIVTEVTIGSAFYAPTLFDHYEDVSFTPSLFYSLPIIRRPSKEIYTCFGGGYIASGSLGKEKMPMPYLPEGLKLLSHEGAGEVQTPVFSSQELDMQKPVFFRYAKAGELCERFNDIQSFRGKSLDAVYKTYRGNGKVFI
jgi:D-serine deaminase-like pyridoxal phosphate-dependent protein